LANINTAPAHPLPPANDPAQAQHPAPKPKPRRRPSKEFAIAAKHRQEQQRYTNFHHRPTKEKDTLWLCEFCEYEAIFGVKPHALIRQYEIKDRKERKRMEEKRRLLEKAKAKNRKGKKGSKKGVSNANSTNVGNAQGGHGRDTYDPNLPPPGGLAGEEEFFDEDFEGEDYDPGDEVEFDEAYYQAQQQGPHQLPQPPPPPLPVSGTTATAGRGSADTGPGGGPGKRVG
jgi:hypothetical protein